MFLAALGVVPAMTVLPGAAAAQECSWVTTAGAAAPAVRALRADGMNLKLTGGWIGGVGRECGSGPNHYGVDAEVEYVYGRGGVYTARLMGRVGRELLADGDDGVPRLDVFGLAGLFRSYRSGDFVEVLIPRRPEEIPGREVDLPATGLALGASARLRFPLASSQSLLVGVGVRASFLPTVELSGLAEDTPGVLVTLPVTVAYRFSL